MTDTLRDEIANVFRAYDLRGSYAYRDRPEKFADQILAIPAIKEALVVHEAILEHGRRYPEVKDLIIPLDTIRARIEK